MASFFQQLRLLLWKNGLGVIRQPRWSLALIIWPLVIFIILVIARSRFPPKLRDPCYVAPRNLPSAGFFPFLQTLLCNTDNVCHNKSRLEGSSTSQSKSAHRGARDTRSLHNEPPGPPVMEIFQTGRSVRSVLAEDSELDQNGLLELWEQIMNSTLEGNSSNISLLDVNSTFFGNQEVLGAMLESVNMLKTSVCNVSLNFLNATSLSFEPLTYGLLTFCKTNDTLLEVTLLTINQALMKVILANPADALKMAGAAVVAFDRLQKEGLFLDGLLSLPQVLLTTNLDQALENGEALLTNIQSTLQIIENTLPEAGLSFQSVSPVLVVGINVFQYLRSWPGRDVYITLGDVIMEQNDTSMLSDIVQTMLKDIRIPLDKAIGLTLDRMMVHSYICENSSNPLWLSTACLTGSVSMLLDWISPEKVAQQALLAWSKDAAPRDVAFAKSMLHSLTGLFFTSSEGEPNNTRSQRSSDAQPQNIGEQLFLGIGSTLLSIMKSFPVLDMPIQALLRAGHTSMQTANQVIYTVEDMVTKVLFDAKNLQEVFQSLMTNENMANNLTGRVMDSVVEVVTKALKGNQLLCEDILSPFSWLSELSSVDPKLWPSLICPGNGSALEDVLLDDWVPVIQKVMELALIFEGKDNNTATLPMILSEWHVLYASYLRVIMLFESPAIDLGVDYLMNWIPENVTVDWAQIVLSRALEAFGNIGSQLENTSLWPPIESYFHMAYYVITYQPNVTGPPNCIADLDSYVPVCRTDFSWDKFTQSTTVLIQNFSENSVLRIVQGTLAVLQGTFEDVYTQALTQLYFDNPGLIPANSSIQAYLSNAITVLEKNVQVLSNLEPTEWNELQTTLPVLKDILTALGLEPLTALLTNSGPINASSVLDSALKIVQNNQYLVTGLYNETDPSLAELEDLIMQYLSLEANLTLPLSLNMGSTLLTYSGSLRPEDLALLRQIINSFTNETSAGIAQSVLQAMEILSQVVDAFDNPQDDPTIVLLGYIRQLQEFLSSAIQLRRFDQIALPGGSLTKVQLTDLHLAVMDLLNLIPLEQLSQDGEMTFLMSLLERLLALLPPDVQQSSMGLINHTEAIVAGLTTCSTEGLDCAAEVSEMFQFLKQALVEVTSGEGNVTIALTPANSPMKGQPMFTITESLLSLALLPNDAANVKTVTQIMDFLQVVLAMPNVTVNDIQNALVKSNFTQKDLDSVVTVLEAANVTDLLNSIINITDVSQCFESQSTANTSSQCALKLISRLTGYLMELPIIPTEYKDFISLIPGLAKQVVVAVGSGESFYSDPVTATMQILTNTLVNIQSNLKELNISSADVVGHELEVVKGILKLVASKESPVYAINTTQNTDPTMVYLKIAQWYLTRLENVTSTSDFIGFLYPLYRLTEMQLANQISQAEFTALVEKEVNDLLQYPLYPLNGYNITKIGQAVVHLLSAEIQQIKVSLEGQNSFSESIDHEEEVNMTLVNEIVALATEYLNITDGWLKDVKVGAVITSMLQWNATMNISTPVQDLGQILQTIAPLLTPEEHQYLDMIDSFVQPLYQALAVASQPGGLQSELFTDAILEPLRIALNLSSVNQMDSENIVEVLSASLQLILQPDMPFEQARNVSLEILERAQDVIHYLLPDMVAEYLLSGIRVMEVYFETISTNGGPDKFNEIIVNELNAIQSLLPPDSDAKSYIALIMNVTHFILDSSQGNTSVLDNLGGLRVDNLFEVTKQVFEEGYPVLLQILTGQGLDLSLLNQTGNENILEVLSASLQLILQPDMPFEQARNVSLEILERAQDVIQYLLPDMVAEYLLSGIQVMKVYFETISTNGGPDKFNEIIVNELNAIQSLLPPDSDAANYISLVINFTHSILNSSQGNTSVWDTLNGLGVENLDEVIKQVFEEGYPVLLQILTGQGLDLSLLNQTGNENILEVLSASLQLILQPDMPFEQARNVSLEILERAQDVIHYLLPDMVAEYLLSGIRVMEVYFETISTNGGPDKFNEIIVNELNAIQSLLPPDSDAKSYIALIMNVTHFILDSSQGNTSVLDNLGGLRVDNLFEVTKQVFEEGYPVLLQILTGQGLDLSLLNQTGNENILEVISASLQLILQPDMPFEQARNVSLEILERAQDVIQYLLPDMVAEYLLSGIQVMKVYFETISTNGGPDKFNEIIVNELNAIQSLLPPDSDAANYISLVINFTHSILNSSQGNTSVWDTLNGLGVENLDEVIKQVFEEGFPVLLQILTGQGLDLSLLNQTGNENIVEVLSASLQLILQPDMPFEQARNVSLEILERAQDVIQYLLPDMVAEYLLSGIRVMEVYFETISTNGGPDKFNEIIVNELNAIQSLLPPDSDAANYISLVINITHSILNSSQGNISVWDTLNGLSVKNLDEVIKQVFEEGFPVLLQILTGQGLDLSLLNQTGNENILEVLSASLQLILQPDMPFEQARNVSLEILERAQDVIQYLLPDMVAEYLLSGIQVMKVYFETISTNGGPDKFNEIIVNGLGAIYSLFPLESDAANYISLVVNITHSILNSSQGNTSLWDHLEGLSVDSLDEVTKQIDQLLKPVLLSILDGNDVMPNLPSPAVLAERVPALLQMLTGQAVAQTWDELEALVQSLLLVLKETPVWGSVPPAASVMSGMVGALVNSMQAESALLLSYELPLAKLMQEIIHSVNASQFNMSDILERLPLAIQQSVEEAEQANGSSAALECTLVLGAWRPVQEAAGLSEETLVSWCNVSLLPVMQAYQAADHMFANLSYITEVLPVNATTNATAAVIVQALRSFYQANLNAGYVTEQAIMVVADQVAQLGKAVPMSSVALWSQQFQELQLQQSVSNVHISMEQLKAVTDPALWPYIKALEKALVYTLKNTQPQILQNTTIQNVLIEAVDVLLASMNITNVPIEAMLSTNGSLNQMSIVHIMNAVARQIVAADVFETMPVIDAVIKQFIVANYSDLILENVLAFLELNSRSESTQTVSVRQITEAMPMIYTIFREFLSLLTYLNVQLPPMTGLFVDLGENVLLMIRQMAATSKLLEPMDYLLSQFQEGLSYNGLQYGSPPMRTRRQAVWDPQRQPMEDIVDLLHVNYNELFKALSVPPTIPDIMDTIHVFFSNPDLSVLMKGLSQDLTGPWSANSSESQIIDTTLGILSDVTLPSQWGTYDQLLIQMVQEGLNLEDITNTELLTKTLGSLVNVATVLSEKPPLEIVQRLEQMVGQLGQAVAQILATQSQGSNTAGELLSALSNILSNNLLEAADVASKITAVIKNILNTVNRPDAQMNLVPYISALDQTIGILSSLLTPEELLYFNTTAQMLKGFAQLTAYAGTTGKMFEAYETISDSLENFLVLSGASTLPDGQPIQSVTRLLIVNSALASQTLWNLSTMNHTFATTQDKESLVNQTIQDLVDLLPEHQKVYVLPLELPIISALSAISNASQIAPAIVGISGQVTRSILTMVNLTQIQVYEGTYVESLILLLTGISDQVSFSVLQGLAMPQYAAKIPTVFLSIRQTVSALMPVVPEEAGSYLNMSLHIMEITAISLNYTGATGDFEGAVSMVSTSVKALLAVLSFPGMESSGNVLADVEGAIQSLLKLVQSDQETMIQVVQIAKLLLHNLNDLLRLTGDSAGVNLTRKVLETSEDTLGQLFADNFTDLTQVTGWTHRLSMVLIEVADWVPEDQPFAPILKNIAISLANESHENLVILEQTIQTSYELYNTSWTDGNFTVMLELFTAQVCALENMTSVLYLMEALSLGPGLVCKTVMPGVQAAHALSLNVLENTEAYDLLLDTFVGDPSTYRIDTNWTSVFTEHFGLNMSSLRSINIRVAPPTVTKVSRIVRNSTAFILHAQQHTSLSPEFLKLLLHTPLPDSNLEILAWLINMRHCNDPSSLGMNQADELIMRVFCQLSPQEWYNFTVLMLNHVNTEQLIYRTVLSSELQGGVEIMLQMATFLMDVMGKLLPAIDRLQGYLVSIKDLNLVANSEFNSLVRGKRSVMSSRATFTTLSRAMCNNGILAVFGLSRLPSMPTEKVVRDSSEEREKNEMIKKFKIPHNANPFCMSLYLDMVSTPGGAIAWAFLKPMLQGQILYSPDTPLTRAIMQKSNATLDQFANLGLYSEDWLKSSSYVMDSAKVLEQTLPMLQNSLNNPFVENFIQMQTDINVSAMKSTLKNFSNMTILLKKNKHIVQQITSLSNLMVNLSSCINFDRYRAFDDTDRMDAEAQALAKDRNLYASVVFNLPKDGAADPAAPAASVLPHRVNYTIRMHMDNVMRTDRARRAYWVKDARISRKEPQRYTRGFVYLQESIDRAIIESHTGVKVTEPAVQLQAFPYPCFLRDEYLEAISFVFPLMLMIAWVLFVADFVKKLVHERELRLHEYMKMMGVNPLSHFFAWFIESAVFLFATIVILTLVLKYGSILPNSDGFLVFLYLCDYGLSLLAISYLVSSFFDKTQIAGLSGSLVYVLCFFPFIVMVAAESTLSFSSKNALGLFAPTCFSYASQYITRYESQGQGIQWSNMYSSPMAGDTTSFGWLCWLMLADSVLYFLIGAYVRIVFPGKHGLASPWYFPLQPSFWSRLLCCCRPVGKSVSRGRLFTNIMHSNQPVFPDDKHKGKETSSANPDEEFSGLPVGVSLHGLTKSYGGRVALDHLNVSFYEGHVTSLLGHNGAGKTTTMSLLTGLFAPSSGSIEVYGRDMEGHLEEVRRELGVCMQYDVHFDHMTVEEHLRLYGQIKAPHWSKTELQEQICKTLQETGMYGDRHKRVGTLSGGMKRKLSISIAFIGGSRLVVLDEPTTGVDPCSRRSIWDIVIKHKKERTIIMSTHHLDEAEVLSDRIAFLERGGLKCCGSPYQLKDKLAQGYNLTLTKKVQSPDSQKAFKPAEVKQFIQAHIPEARLKKGEVGDLVYSLPPFTSSNAGAYRSLLKALDANLDALQLGCYGISDTTLEEVFLQLTQDELEPMEDKPWSVSESMSDSVSMDSLDLDESLSSFSDKASLVDTSVVQGLALAWQQFTAILVKRFHHSRRDWKGLLSQVVMPVLFVVAAMALGSVKSDLQHFPPMELSPALYNFGTQYSFFSNPNPNSKPLVEAMMSFPGLDNTCLDNPNSPVCTRGSVSSSWETKGNSSQPIEPCKCTRQEQVCRKDQYQPPHKKTSSDQVVYNLSSMAVENYLLSTADDFIRDRYGGFDFGQPLPASLRVDLMDVPQNRTLSKVWYNPEGYHSMPAYLNSLNNLILRANLPAAKDPQKYSISVSSHPYYGRADDEDSVVQGLIQILVAMCVLTGYAIMTASFVTYEVQEHHSGAKGLQHISGIGEPFYWAANFFYDMALYLIPVAITVAVIAAFQIPAFTDRQNLSAVTLLLVLFGFATFPWMYLLSGVFKDTEMAFITYVCINLFISVNTIISTSIFFFLGQLKDNNEVVLEIYRILSHVFLVFPQFSFGNGLMELARNEMEVQLLSGYGVDAYRAPFSMDGLGWMFVSLVLQGCACFTLRLLLNKWLIRKVRRLICRVKGVPRTGSEDEDVLAEHQRVASGAANSDLLQVNQLTKVYQQLHRKVPAVKKLSVGIPAGECFGLLGVNGAGKTTTFKMLTGDVSPTEGTAQIMDRDGRMVDIMECRNQGINIGYCPQEDALDDLLTGEEHLYFYARIRGIPKREIDRVVNYLLMKLELRYHRNTISDSYSCGTRRKLSTALALIGHPQILLLDEPSSGMDPRTKRHLWRIISEEVKGKCAVVLTSHSMEECEALCTRLAIMVKGEFRCLGSLQHIKNRFGCGFTVKMYLAVASCDVSLISNFMQELFPSTYLKDQHSSMVEYHVPVAPGGVADIFDKLESNKSALQIKHFSVSQTTLDEVFINFAMGKVGMETVPLCSESLDSDRLKSIEAVDI